MLVLVEGLGVSRYCKFHQYHEYRTDKCKTFKKADGDLDSSKKKKLREFVRKTNSHRQYQDSHK